MFEKTERWPITWEQAVAIAGGGSELAKLRGLSALLISNAIMKVERGQYVVLGSRLQVNDIRSRLEAGQTRLLMYQRAATAEKTGIGTPISQGHGMTPSMPGARAVFSSHAFSRVSRRY